MAGSQDATDNGRDFQDEGDERGAEDEELAQLAELNPHLLTRNSSLERRITQTTQNARNPLPTSCLKRRQLIHAHINRRRKCDPGSIVSLAEPTSPKETIPPPFDGHHTCSSSVVQNPPRSGSPASHTSAQNPTPPMVDGLESGANNELFQLQRGSRSGQDIGLQSVPLLRARDDEQQSQTIAQTNSNTQQAGIHLSNSGRCWQRVLC